MDWTLVTGLQGEYAAISTNVQNLFGSDQGRLIFPTMQSKIIKVWHLLTNLTGEKGSAAEAAFMTGLERNSDIVYG